MPTYEFRCPDGTIVERIFKMSDVPAEIPSPNGDGVATRMISGGAGLLFKGTGFYITDYKNKQGGAKKDGGGESKSTEAKPTEAKPASTTKASESKPAAPAAVATPKK